ncbi:hypothetical protein J26TS2_44930 [Shouchella clausii]|nr:hypothetical protein J26TS2_44930 [Shouchella clausii]
MPLHDIFLLLLVLGRKLVYFIQALILILGFWVFDKLICELLPMPVMLSSFWKVGSVWVIF